MNINGRFKRDIQDEQDKKKNSMLLVVNHPVYPVHPV
jgi:hypothetical protein